MSKLYWGKIASNRLSPDEWWGLGSIRQTRWGLTGDWQIARNFSGYAMAHLAQRFEDKDRAEPRKFSRDEQRDLESVFETLKVLDSQQTQELSMLFHQRDFAALLKVVQRCLRDEASLLDDAFINGDLVSILRSAHKLVGMAGNYGIVAISETARTLYTQAKAEKMNECRELGEVLHNLIEGAGAEIDSLLAVLVTDV